MALKLSSTLQQSTNPSDVRAALQQRGLGTAHASERRDNGGGVKRARRNVARSGRFWKVLSVRSLTVFFGIGCFRQTCLSQQLCSYNEIKLFEFKHFHNPENGILLRDCFVVTVFTNPVHANVRRKKKHKSETSQLFDIFFPSSAK